MKNVLPPFLNSTFYILNFTFTFEIPPLAALGRDDKSSLFSPLSLAFTLFKGEGGPLAVDEGCPDLTISTAPKSRMVSPHQALRARSLRGKPCIEPCSSPLLRSVQDPSARSLLQGSQKVSKNFLGRGAAGAAGKATSIARRLPWRLDATRSG